MHFLTPMRPAVFVQRLNRFATLLVADSSEVLAHLPNSGRLRELLVPGTSCLLMPQPYRGGNRRTAYDLTLVRLAKEWVCVDARLPSRLLSEALESAIVAPLRGMRVARTEAWYAESRLDLLLTGPKGECLAETKCVTLVEDGVARFPDAPTDRGRRHLAALTNAVHNGRRATVIFVVQRQDANSFAPNDATDPSFGLALRHAATQGVEVYAYRCSVTPTEIRSESALPVRWPNVAATASLEKSFSRTTKPCISI